MTSLKTLSALVASALLFTSGVASAADYSAPAATTTAKPADTQKSALSTKTAAARTPGSIACSKEADARGLHGKERKTFRASCKLALKHGRLKPDAKKT
jgi:hypothetical protein